MKNLRPIFITWCAIQIIITGQSFAGDNAGNTYYLSAENLNQSESKLIWLTDKWLYHPGDNFAWAAPDFDDSNWESVNPAINLRAKYPKEGWQGIGWFRLHLKVDSALQDKPLGIRLRHFGASEIYLDGKPLLKLGRVGKNKQEEIRFYPQYPRTIIFSGEYHVLAVRYSNHSQNKYVEKLGNLGFNMNIGHIDDAISVKLVWSVRFKTYMIIIMVVSLLLALFHFILFIYNPRQKLNLYLALLSVSFAAYALFSFQNHFTSNPDLFILFSQLRYITSVVLVLLQLLTVYKIFYQKIPWWFFIFLAYGVLIIILIAFPSSRLGLYDAGFMALGFAEAARAGLFKGLKRKGGYWIIVTGLVVLFLSIVFQLLISFQIISSLAGMFLVHIYGFLGFLLSMSVFLAMQFARTSRNLQQQLVEVKKLSEKMLEQERIAKEQEIARHLLEADNKRKTEELEEARDLQLSLLPKTVPQPPGLEIAAFMKTATEVGGDYYDFCTGADGSLTVAIGDATGHGMRAGLMVSLIKSLFLAEAPCMDVSSFLNISSQTLRQMQLGSIYMALTLFKIKDDQISVSVAGMPPVFIYRHRKQLLEQIIIKELPLGGPGEKTYRELNRRLDPGDTILLMSDGFPELFNDEMEMLDYSRVKSIFREVASQSPQDIVAHLKKAALKWLNGKPQDDDITFVVLKRKLMD